MWTVKNTDLLQDLRVTEYNESINLHASEILGSHSGIAEDSSLLGCDTV